MSKLPEVAPQFRALKICAITLGKIGGLPAQARRVGYGASSLQLTSFFLTAGAPPYAQPAEAALAGTPGEFPTQLPFLL